MKPIGIYFFVLSYKFSELLIYHVGPESGPEKIIILARLLIYRVLIYRGYTVVLKHPSRYHGDRTHQTQQTRASNTQKSSSV